MAQAFVSVCRVDADGEQVPEGPIDGKYLNIPESGRVRVSFDVTPVNATQPQAWRYVYLTDGVITEIF